MTWNPFAPTVDSAVAGLTKALRQLEKVSENAYAELNDVQERERELLHITERSSRIAIKLRDLVN